MINTHEYLVKSLWHDCHKYTFALKSNQCLDQVSLNIVLVIKIIIMEKKNKPINPFFKKNGRKSMADSAYPGEVGWYMYDRLCFIEFCFDQVLISQLSFVELVEFILYEWKHFMNSSSGISRSKVEINTSIRMNSY